MYADYQEVRVNSVDARIINHKSKQVLTLEMSCPWIDNRARKRRRDKTLKYGELMKD